MKSNESTLRAHIAVLKSAVQKEQQTSAELRQRLIQQQHEYQKLAEELDSMSFNNRRLVKRIETLQDSNQDPPSGLFLFGGHKEMDTLKNELKACKKELEIKISDNEKLCRQIYEQTHESAVNTTHVNASTQTFIMIRSTETNTDN